MAVQKNNLNVVCSFCGKKFHQKPSRIKERNYCCRECMGKHRAMLYEGEKNPNYKKDAVRDDKGLILSNETVFCEHCKKEINKKKAKRYNNKWYCNRHYIQLKKYGQIKKTIFDKNEYVEYEDHIALIIDNKSVLIDKEDLEIVMKRKWHIDSSGYCCTKIKGKTIHLHSYIMNTKDKNIVVDHINNKETLDNRKSNLRIATKSQNMMNSSLSKRNKTGVKGVNHYKNNKYIVRICVNNTKKIIGYYKDFNEAVMARFLEEIKLFKEYSIYYSKKTNLFTLIYEHDGFTNTLIANKDGIIIMKKCSKAIESDRGFGMLGSSNK